MPIPETLVDDIQDQASLNSHDITSKLKQSGCSAVHWSMREMDRERSGDSPTTDSVRVVDAPAAGLANRSLANDSSSKPVDLTHLANTTRREMAPRN